MIIFIHKIISAAEMRIKFAAFHELNALLFYHTGGRTNKFIVNEQPTVYPR